MHLKSLEAMIKKTATTKKKTKSIINVELQYVGQRRIQNLTGIWDRIFFENI